MSDAFSTEILEFVLAREVARQEGQAGGRERCWGSSSDALTLYAVGKGPRPQVPGRPNSPSGGSWHGSEVGRNYPHDESDLRACERTYAMAPELLKVVMLPVLQEFQAWVREGKNRYGEQIRQPHTPRAGSGITGMTFKGPGFETQL